MENVIIHICEVLAAEKSLYEILLTLAREKQEQILGNRVEELLETIKQEKETLQQIEIEEEKRADLLQGFAEGETSFGQICERADAATTDRLKLIREELLSTLEELTEINDVNKRLLQDVLHLNRQIFKSLSNESAGYGYHPEKAGEPSNMIMDKRA